MLTVASLNKILGNGSSEQVDQFDLIRDKRDDVAMLVSVRMNPNNIGENSVGL